MAPTSEMRIQQLEESHSSITNKTKHRKNCETALTPGIPSISGIQECEIWLKL